LGKLAQNGAIINLVTMTRLKTQPRQTCKLGCKTVDVIESLLDPIKKFIQQLNKIFASEDR
jgi:hypothetical protein